ncbi:hypothetical protein ASC66_05460 [Leifsonia sp. Root4]|uniref:class I SAM-dependent methyltransferase n=1 Tax=Leifsonia sp. Root4 TaxID=1736525 RepID=UPI0007021AA0|nr:class I SAM-dependent methyltransferase [Leifsonia sp. Root4]KQW08353.1 hypothetical protein ASC66_05460 [Leifsonia sp. Root4]
MTAPHSHTHAHDDASIAEILDLDAVVLTSTLGDITTWVGERVRSPQRILDVGAGSGAGTVALAERFPTAQLLAADRSAGMLDRVRGAAAAAGVAGRVSTVRMDFDGAWPELGAVDLAWASASLHELADAARAFGVLAGVLSPGGLLVVVEMDGPPRFLSGGESTNGSTNAGTSAAESGDGAAELEAHIHELLAEKRSPAHDHPDWSDGIERAGFTRIEKASFVVDLPLEPDAVGGRYAQAYLRRLAPVAVPRMTASERALFEQLIADDGPLSLRRRGDLRLRTGRTVWAARRP